MDALLAAADADSGGDDSYDEAEVDPAVGDEALLSTAPAAGDDSALSAANELEVDDNALECQITEFFPRQAKMCYKITGRTTLRAWPFGPILHTNSTDLSWMCMPVPVRRMLPSAVRGTGWSTQC